MKFLELCEKLFVNAFPEKIIRQDIRAAEVVQVCASDPSDPSSNPLLARKLLESFEHCSIFFIVTV